MPNPRKPRTFIPSKYTRYTVNPFTHTHTLLKKRKECMTIQKINMPNDQNTEKRGQSLRLPSTSTMQYNHNVKRTGHPDPCSPAEYPHEKSITTIKSIARNQKKHMGKKYNKMAKKETVQYAKNNCACYYNYSILKTAYT